MSDLIYRQDAINLLKKWSDGYEYIETDTELAIKEFKYLPSAQPEPVRHGRWTVTPVYIKCSECGESFMLIPQNYCPNCGARMEV